MSLALRLTLFTVLTAVFVAVTAGAGGAQTMDPARAKEIIRQVDELLRGDSSRATVEMRVVTRRWKRTMGMEIWSLGTEKALVRITSPRKEAGTATLKDGSDIWNYLPKIDRTIRVPSSMMASAWMGSHFTNDDLVKESQLVNDYDVELTFEGERNGRRVWEFRLTPRPDVPVVWGVITYQVLIDEMLPEWARYYGEDGELKRTMTFHEIKQMGNRRVPSIMRLVPADEPDEYTEMVYSELEFDVAIPERMFSLAALRQ